MPFVYTYGSGGFNSNITTSATPNTEQDDAYVSVTSGVNQAWTWGLAFYVGGKAAGLTVISGIGFRVKQWTSTTSTSGNQPLSGSPTPRDVGDQNINTAQIGFGFRAPSALTSGTGGPNFLGAFTCGATGPGGWVCPNAGSIMRNTPNQASGSKSIDLFSSSGTASLPYEALIEIFGAA